MDTFESQHCTACGLERRIVYSEPIARGYELRSLHCQNCSCGWYARGYWRRRRDGVAPFNLEPR
jgi:hypothetical protein